MPTLNDLVTALFAAEPISGDNPVGAAARSALVSRLKGATPGRHSEPWPRTGDTFLHIFYPSYAADPNVGAVTPQTGFGDDWWAGFSVVALCQAMYNVTSDLRPQIKQPDVDNQVSALNAALNPRLNALYLYLLSTIPASAVAAPLAQIPSDQRPQAQQVYAGFMQNPAWISAKVAQAASGQWTNQVWELFHHWMKLSALGMSASAIDALIGSLVQKGLPVAAQVGAGRWESYQPWMTPSTLGWNDLRGDATYGMLTQVCTSYPGSMFPSCMNEENSFEFTANSQPGSPWRSPPGGSCFLAGTPILMGNGALKPIEGVVAGDMVATRSGPRRVLATVSLVHQGYQLYGLNGLSFRFTGTHPFITTLDGTQRPGPRLACASPIDLMNTVPSLSSFGIARLGPDCPPLAGFSGGAVVPFPVRSLDAYPAQPGDVTIHDLVVDFDAEGLSEYVAGDGRNMLVVSAEAPRFGAAPEATRALIELLNASWPAVRQALAPLPADRWADGLYHGLYVVSTNLLADSIRAVQGGGAPTGHGGRPVGLQALARGAAEGLMQPMGDGPPVYDGQQGAYFAALMSVLGDEFNDAINMGWRDFKPIADSDATMLAVSALSVEFTAADSLPSHDPITVRITLGSGPSAVSRTLAPIGPLPSISYFQQFDQVVYFDNWRPLPSGGWPVSVELLLPNGSALPFAGATSIPGGVPHGYRLFNAPISSAAGEVVGQFSFDVRPLDALAMASEMSARSGWTAAAAATFAQALGTQAATLMNQRFPSAVLPFVQPRHA